MKLAAPQAPFYIRGIFISQAHISSLIKSKFTNYKDFDTLMYTCAAEFDFMEKEVGVSFMGEEKKKNLVVILWERKRDDGGMCLVLLSFRPHFATRKPCCFR